MPIVPDAKNWTWVLERPCMDCGFDAAAVDVMQIGSVIRANARQWPELLEAEHARLRPTDDQWSALEYGCHLRDVFLLFDYRLQLMLEEDGPRFKNWDQDATASDQQYDQQDPEEVSRELLVAADDIATRFESVADDQWQRTGYRSDGAAFTIASYARYLLHDPIHHLDDVARGNQAIADGLLD